MLVIEPERQYKLAVATAAETCTLQQERFARVGRLLKKPKMI